MSNETSLPATDTTASTDGKSTSTAVGGQEDAHSESSNPVSLSAQPNSPSDSAEATESVAGEAKVPLVAAKSVSMDDSESQFHNAISGEEESKMSSVPNTPPPCDPTVDTAKLARTSSPLSDDESGLLKRMDEPDERYESANDLSEELEKSAVEGGGPPVKNTKEVSGDAPPKSDDASEAKAVATPVEANVDDPQPPPLPKIDNDNDVQKRNEIVKCEGHDPSVEEADVETSEEVVSEETVGESKELKNASSVDAAVLSESKEESVEEKKAMSPLPQDVRPSLPTVEGQKAGSLEDEVPEDEEEEEEEEKRRMRVEETDAEENVDDEDDNDDEEEDIVKLDDDEIKSSPAYIPKSGRFYMHDVRNGGGAEEDTEGDVAAASTVPDDAAGGEPLVEGEAAAQAVSAKRVLTSRADRKWEHDLFDDRVQRPKTAVELIRRYGRNIRLENCEGGAEEGGTDTDNGGQEEDNDKNGRREKPRSSGRRHTNARPPRQRRGADPVVDPKPLNNGVGGGRRVGAAGRNRKPPYGDRTDPPRREGPARSNRRRSDEHVSDTCGSLERNDGPPSNSRGNYRNQQHHLQRNNDGSYPRQRAVGSSQYHRNDGSRRYGGLQYSNSGRNENNYGRGGNYGGQPPRYERDRRRTANIEDEDDADDYPPLPSGGRGGGGKRYTAQRQLHSNVSSTVQKPQNGGSGDEQRDAPPPVQLQTQRQQQPPQSQNVLRFGGARNIQSGPHQQQQPADAPPLHQQSLPPQRQQYQQRGGYNQQQQPQPYQPQQNRVYHNQYHNQQDGAGGYHHQNGRYQNSHQPPSPQHFRTDIPPPNVNHQTMNQGGATNSNNYLNNYPPIQPMGHQQQSYNNGPPNTYHNRGQNQRQPLRQPTDLVYYDPSQQQPSRPSNNHSNNYVTGQQPRRLNIAEPTPQ